LRGDGGSRISHDVDNVHTGKELGHEVQVEDKGRMLEDDALLTELILGPSLQATVHKLPETRLPCAPTSRLQSVSAESIWEVGLSGDVGKRCRYIPDGAPKLPPKSEDIPGFSRMNQKICVTTHQRPQQGRPAAPAANCDDGGLNGCHLNLVTLPRIARDQPR
jgi:hypothetical protein